VLSCEIFNLEYDCMSKLVTHRWRRGTSLPAQTQIGMCKFEFLHLCKFELRKSILASRIEFLLIWCSYLFQNRHAEFKEGGKCIAEKEGDLTIFLRTRL
jgi:hypothetical protein